MKVRLGRDIAILDYVNLEQIHYDASEGYGSDLSLYSLEYDKNLYHKFDEREIWIQEAIEKTLEPLEVYVINGYFYRGLSFREMANEVGYSEKYLMVQFSRAKKKMKKFLKINARKSKIRL